MEQIEAGFVQAGDQIWVAKEQMGGFVEFWYVTCATIFRLEFA